MATYGDVAVPVSGSALTIVAVEPVRALLQLGTAGGVLCAALVSRRLRTPSGR